MQTGDFITLRILMSYESMAKPTIALITFTIKINSRYGLYKCIIIILLTSCHFEQLVLRISDNL